MRMLKKLSVLVASFATGIIGFIPPAYAAHTGGPVTLMDAGGNAIAVGSTTPYSPKQTCMTTGCHTGQYENTFAEAVKDHGPNTPSYSVPYPQHGVSAGYHFQQGRNVSWNSNNENAQRSFYKVQNFTSSTGMYGKF